jgi:hypothetical protein
MNIKNFNNILPYEINDQILLRKKKYSHLNSLKWISGLISILFALDLFNWMINWLPFSVSSLLSYIFSPFVFLIFFVWIWGNLFWIYNFLTIGLGKLSYNSLYTKIWFLGFNFACGNFLLQALQNL